MSRQQEFLDAFADARRTWDDFVALQPDIVAGSGRLRTEDDVVEIGRRIHAHRQAMGVLADALDAGPGERRA